MKFPEDFIQTVERVKRALSPIKPVDSDTIAKEDFIFTGIRAARGSDLPSQHLLYFMLVELLGYEDLGRFEKVAWSIPIDFEGRAFLIEHRKMGLGIFVQEDADVDNAKRIANLLKKGTKYSEIYFKWKAEQAVKDSKFNVKNNSRQLFERYEFLAERAKILFDEAELRKEERIKTQHTASSWSTSYPAYRIRKEGNWLAMAAIDAFFSWTEHVFIHIAILNSTLTTGQEFKSLSNADWSTKFKAALDISNLSTKIQFDKLSSLRRQVRNFVAHGAFGKDGETLHFHSKVGAVPVLLDVSTNAGSFVVGDRLGIQAQDALEILKQFIEFLWSGERKSSWIYIQDYELPLILTMAQDGTYKKAMSTPEDMEHFANILSGRMDNAANMDW